jgi:GMP synthase-like glutamine amidotransferase
VIGDTALVSRTDGKTAAREAEGPASAPILVVEHEAAAGAALIGERVDAGGFRSVVVGPDRGASVPGRAAGYAGVVVLGGSIGPTDDDVAPWLPATRELIRNCVATGTPLLAVCLGAELAAVALGGTVAALPAAEVGLLSVDVEAGSDPLLGGVPVRVATLQWHWLQVTEPPPGAVVLASSEGCRVQAFRVGERAWATQFHLEAVASTARTWMSDETQAVAALGLVPEQVVAEWEGAAGEVEKVWTTVIDRWLAVARDAWPVD